MLKTFFSQKNNFFVAAILAVSGLTSVALATDSVEDADVKLRFFKERTKKRPSANIVVLGPKDNGKSTLINLLIHTSEYATLATKGDVLLDSYDPLEPIYHRDIFRFDITKPVDPKAFKSTGLSADFNNIPNIELFMPVLGPIPVKDFIKEQSATSLEEYETEAEKMKGGTQDPHVYRSHAKVTKHVFQNSFVDAPGIGPLGRLAFFKKVIEKSPSDRINTLLLVVSAKELTDDKFGSSSFAFFKEIAEILKQVDPTFTRVQLAITHAGYEEFQTMISAKADPRRFASERFLKATGILVSLNRVFFFENQYNCLSHAAMDRLHSCFTGGNTDSDIQTAIAHRQKNYKINVLESFNLLKDASKTSPVSRSDLLQKINADTVNELSSGQIGMQVNASPKSYLALGKLEIPEGTWQITASSSYSGSDGNAYYMHNIHTSPNSNEGTRLGVDHFIGSLAREQGIGTASPIIKVVRITAPTTFYLNVQTQLYLAGVGTILGEITAVRLVTSED